MTTYKKTIIRFGYIFVALLIPYAISVMRHYKGEKKTRELLGDAVLDN